MKKIELSIYELAPHLVGSFDVVVCGGLLLHLRDPIRALEAVRSICTRHFRSLEQIDAALTLVHPKLPVTQLSGIERVMQWHVPNRAGHIQMVTSAGFHVERQIRPYAIPFGSAHGSRESPWRWAKLKRTVLHRAIVGGTRVPHSAILATPV